MLSLVQCVGLFSTITYHREQLTLQIIPLEATTTPPTKPEILILPVRTTLQWTCMLIAPDTTRLTEIPSSEKEKKEKRNSPIKLKGRWWGWYHTET